MTNSRKLEIRTPIESSRCDPLKKFFMYKGVQNPITDDGSFLSLDTDDGTRLRWSLGGWNGEGSDAVPLSASTQPWSDWEAARDNPSEYQDGNPYMAIAPSEKVVPLPGMFKDLLKNSILLILNSEQIAERLDRTPVKENGRLTGEANRFYSVLESLAPPDGSLQRHIQFIRSEPTAFMNNTLLDTVLVATTDQGLHDGDAAALYRAISGLFGTETIIEAAQHQLRSNAGGGYEALNLSITTPFVTRASTFPAIEESLEDNGTAEVNPEYNIYDKLYENTIIEHNFSENLQPNIYTFGLFAESEEDEDGNRINEAWQASPATSDKLQDQYAELVTLRGRIDGNTLSPRSMDLREYFKSFSEQMTSWQTSGGGISLSNFFQTKVKEMMSKLIVPATETDLLKDFGSLKRSFPMYIETSFLAPAAGSMSSVFLENDCSSTILDYCQRNQENKESFDVSTDAIGIQFINIGPNGGQGDPAQRSTIDLASMPMTVNDFDSAWTSTIGNTETPGEIMKALVLTREGKGPITAVTPTITQKELLISTARRIRTYSRENMMSYSSYLQPDSESPSDVLGYKLSKYDTDNNLVQEISIGNSKKKEILSYIDTQVKYNTEYRYELHEHRIVIATKYDLFVLDAFLGSEESRIVTYDICALENPVIKIVDVPIYGSAFSPSNTTNTLISRCIRYPKVKVLDRPPSQPDLQVLPILNNNRQVKLLIHPNSGDFTGERSREVISISDYAETISNLMAYQKNFENYRLPPGHLEYKNEDIKEIRKAKVFKTSNILSDPQEYKDLYSSFTDRPGNEVYSLTLSLDPGDDFALSFDFIDNTLTPNQYYYYTCLVEDAHGNPSLPSPIYRVRLVSDKGVYYPEIDLYQPKMMKRQVPTKKFARFIQIQASDIQSFPHTEQTSGGTYRSIKNLGSQLGKAIVGNDFVVRFTSRDTGRKMDLKLTFSEKQNLIEDENPIDGE